MPSTIDQTDPGEAKAQRWSSIRFWCSVFISLFGVIYLVLVLLGKTEHFQTADGIVFVAILILASGLLDKIASLSISGSGIQFQVREVERRVAEQKDQIEKLKWLIGYFASDAELEHLRRLAQDGAAKADRMGSDLAKMQTELRALCERKLIQRRENKTIGSLKSSDDLKDWFILLDRGREYLKLRDQE